MGRTICVYCSSSDRIDEAYFEAARAVGREIGRRGHELVYGGANRGLMKAVAQSTLDAGGRVTGVIPQAIADHGLTESGLDELIVTRDLRERKAAMEKRADAFLALPGGFGTLEELLEVLTLKQLRLHDKPIALLNVSGHFEPLMAAFEGLIDSQFVHEQHRSLYGIFGDVAAAFEHLEAEPGEDAPDKWS